MRKTTKTYSAIVAIPLVFGMIMVLSAMSRPADVASKNLSLAADNFEINRRIVFYNGITDTYMLTIEGLCSIGNFDTADRVSITCKTGPVEFKKHYLGLSDNVTYFVEQLDSANVSEYHYRVMFRPQTIIPDVQVDVNAKELMTDRY